jgi:hypothetical protein
MIKLKKRSAPLAIKEMWINTTLRVHPSPVRMATTKKTHNYNCWWGCRGKGTSRTASGMYTSAASMEIIKVHQEVKNRPALWLPYHAWAHLKEFKSVYKRDTCTCMSFTPLCTIAKLWKQPRCPTTSERIKKIWHIYTHNAVLAQP